MVSNNTVVFSHTVVFDHTLVSDHRLNNEVANKAISRPWADVGSLLLSSDVYSALLLRFDTTSSDESTWYYTTDAADIDAHTTSDRCFTKTAVNYMLVVNC